MADGKFLIGKPAGGITTVTVVDGVDNTNLILPASGTVATLGNIPGFKNYIINGKKVVNQRGLTATDNSYNQDRWYKAGNNWFQGIEGDNNLISGKTYTLSWVGGATASYYVGTATSSTINSQTFTPITNGKSFTLTISAGQNLWIKFVSDATGSTFNFVQLEEGSVATPFENRPYGLELSLCQRYAWYSNESIVGMINVYPGGAQQVSTTIKYPVMMRVIPTVSITSDIAINSYQGITKNQFTILQTISQGGAPIITSVSASAEL